MADFDHEYNKLIVFQPHDHPQVFHPIPPKSAQISDQRVAANRWIIEQRDLFEMLDNPRGVVAIELVELLVGPGLELNFPGQDVASLV